MNSYMIQAWACAFAVIFRTGALTVVCNTMGMLIIMDTTELESVNVVCAEDWQRVPYSSSVSASEFRFVTWETNVSSRC